MTSRHADVSAPAAPAVPGRLARARAALRSRRVVRRQRLTAARELAGFATPAERDEREAMLGRTDPAQARAIERLVPRRQAA